MEEVDLKLAAKLLTDEIVPIWLEGCPESYRELWFTWLLGIGQDSEDILNHAVENKECVEGGEVGADGLVDIFRK